MTCLCHTICRGELHYTDNSNRADIPTDIGVTTTHLNLKDNQITELSGGPFDHLTSLEALYLDNNKIASISETVFSIIKLTIKELYLTHNKLTTVTFMNTSFPNIISIKLSRNLITQIPQVFDLCPSLRTVLLDKNRISQIDTNAFQVISNTLEILSFSFNQLTNLDYMNFNFSNIAQLKLDNNPLSTIPVGFYAHIPTVYILFISTIGITNVPSNAFNSNTKIIRLYLNHNSLVNVDFLGGTFEKMIYLYLNGNQLSSFNIDPSWRFPRLKIICLQNNPLTSVSLTVTHNMPILQELRLEDTQITS